MHILTGGNDTLFNFLNFEDTYNFFYNFINTFQQNIPLIGTGNIDVVLNVLHLFIYDLFIKASDNTRQISKILNVVRNNKSLIVLSNGDTTMHTVITNTPKFKEGNTLASFLKLLIKCGINKNARNSETHSPLYLAIDCNRNIETIKVLPDSGCHIGQGQEYPFPTHMYIYNIGTLK